MKKTIATPNLLLDLPNELIEIIFDHLPSTDKVSLKNTNHLLHEIFHDKFIYTIKPSWSRMGKIKPLNKFKSIVEIYPREIQYLDLSYGSITDKELATVLTNFPNLTHLNLSRTNITDAGLAAIAQHCPNLTDLYLSYTSITDAELIALAQHCSNLTTLNLSYTNITNEGLKEIAKLKQLTTLNLKNSHITDAGIRAIPENCPTSRL